MEEMPPVPPIPPETSKKERQIALAVLVFCFLTAVGNWFFGLRDHLNNQQASGSSPTRELTESLLADSADLGVIAVEGAIMYKADGGFGGSKGASGEHLVQLIQQAEKDGVKGLLIKINSPGGSAAASQAVYEQLMKIRKRSNIKIVSAMGDVAASGGYYIACASDIIVANPATLTGSIGVIAQFSHVKGLMQKLGVSTTVLKSGKFKDIGSPFRDASEADKQLMQNIINDTYEQFLDAVTAGRKMPKANIRKLADGRIYTGNQALKNHLVDKLGDYSVALDMLKKMTQAPKNARIKDYSKPSLNDLFSMIGAKLQFSSSGNPLEQITGHELLQLNKVPLMLYY